MLVSLITETTYTSLQLPDWVDGQYFVRCPSTGRELFCIIGYTDHWKLKPCEGSQILDTLKEGRLVCGSVLRVRLGTTMRKAILYAEASDIGYAKYARCLVGANERFTIGSSNEADIRIVGAMIAPIHCILRHANSQWSAEAIDQSVGIFVNGKRMQSVNLQPGDVLSILNQRFIFLPGLLTLNAQNLDPDHITSRLRAIHGSHFSAEEVLGKPPEQSFFHRQPRFTNGLFEGDFQVTAPPPQQTMGGSDNTALAIGPAVATGALHLLGGGLNPLVGLFSIASSLLFPSMRRQKQKEQAEQAEAQRQEQYTRYLEKLESELEQLNRQQCESLNKCNPRLDREIEALKRDRASLWNRRPDHADFLDIRLGTGNIPIQANIRFPNGAEMDSSDPMMQELQKLQKKPRLLTNVPIMLQLQNYYSIGITGRIHDRVAMAVQALLQLTLHVGYDELKLCIIGRLPRDMACLRWLPHTWNDTGSVHMVARDKDELSQLLPMLDKELSAFRNRKNGSEFSGNGTMIFLITDEKLAHSGMMTRLLFDRPCEGVHVISLAEHSRDLPRHTNLSVGVSGKSGRMVWQAEGTKEYAEFTTDPSVIRDLEAMVRLMTSCRLDLQEETSQMPEVLAFLDMYNVKELAQLNVLSRWRRSNPMHNLSVPIGICEDGNLCYLDLHERGDGPHGLVAGTTGSGKSEMLMNLILSLAVSFSPQELSFILIDYKGGGMAHAFQKLPHTAGIITNLDGSEITRSLKSIESELLRRQRVFAEAQEKVGIRNIDIYKYQRLFREGAVSEPLSHLVIISDEFAELKTQQPEFLDYLIRTARIGRSLGVHLILATQKPGGIVDDQIRSNSNFRICLRVQDVTDSRDVLNCDDACHLTRAGSMFKQVGYGEVLVKAQSGWTGADYAPDSISLPDCGVDVLNGIGTVIGHMDAEDTQNAAAKRRDIKSQLESITEYLTKLGEAHKIYAAKLWTPVLEENISLMKLRKEYQVQAKPWVLEPIVGELDDPAHQCRNIVKLPLAKNTLVCGAVGSGKMMFLRAALEDLLLTHSAQEMHVYIVDGANDGLAIYQDAPQVGDVITCDEKEKMVRFINYLNRQLEIRKKKLSGALSGKPLEVRLEQAGLPNILVVLHHILSIQTSSEEMMNSFQMLMTEGPKYGILFLGSLERGSGLRLQTMQQFAQRYVLQMDSDDDYLYLLGRTNGMKPAAIQGRGLMKEDVFYEFQTATQDQDPEALCRTLREGWRGKAATPIRLLPEHVTVELLEQMCEDDAIWKLPVALNTRSIEPEYLDFEDRRVYLALGRTRDLENTLRGIARVAQAKGLNTLLMTRPDPEKIREIFAWCQQVYQAMNSGKQISPAPPTLMVVPDLPSILEQLDGETAEMLTALIEKHREAWNMGFLIGGSPERMKAHQRTKWFADGVDAYNGIFLGDGFVHQALLLCDSCKTEEIEYPTGYMILGGRQIRARFVQSTGGA